MISLRFDQVAHMTGGTLYNTATAERTFEGVSIDSRSIRPGELFVAIRGSRVDGHLFIDQAIARGATGIISEFTFSGVEQIRGDVAVIAVENSHEAMIRLAAQYRHMSKARFIGITGSNGKTTTKELLYHMMRVFEPATYRSPGNLNNLFGAPLSLFAMPQLTRVAVMELGISIPGEMARLAAIVQPDVVVITNISATHLETLGTPEGVAREKLRLVHNAKRDTQLIINADDAALVKEAQNVRSDFVTFGLSPNAKYHPVSVAAEGSSSSVVTIEGHSFRLPLFGRHQVYNLLAAYAVCRELSYSFDHVNTEGIEFDTAPMRGQTVMYSGITFVADCYNANPESVRSGLSTLSETKTSGRRIIALGDMLELGAQEKEYHREIGRSLAGITADLFVLVGPLSKHTADATVGAGVASNRVKHFADAMAAAEFLKQYLGEGDFVFVKGSRGIRLERILEKWEPKGAAH